MSILRFIEHSHTSRKTSLYVDETNALRTAVYPIDYFTQNLFFHPHIFVNWVTQSLFLCEAPPLWIANPFLFLSLKTFMVYNDPCSCVLYPLLLYSIWGSECSLGKLSQTIVIRFKILVKWCTYVSVQ